jgi:Protein of unknown function (DUF2934)
MSTDALSDVAFIPYADSRDRNRRRGSYKMKSRKKTPKAVKTPTSNSRNHDNCPMGPSFEEIQTRAYELYVVRGRTDGQDLNDWFQAEKELAEVGSSQTSA